ncbi:hypothetical protein D4S03_01720 [bacterium]|nr:MAG: hypothetical protein D4S03_01720 [bacterium]
MSNEKSMSPRMSRYYRITVEGKIDATWSEWLGGMRLVSQKEADYAQVTTLSGVLIDQAALRSVLNRIWDLNLVLRSVQEVDPVIISTIE